MTKRNRRIRLHGDSMHNCMVLGGRFGYKRTAKALGQEAWSRWSGRDPVEYLMRLEVLAWKMDMRSIGLRIEE